MLLASAFPAMRLTDAFCTPFTPLSALSTADEHEEHVIPVTFNTNVSELLSALP